MNQSDEALLRRAIQLLVGVVTATTSGGSDGRTSAGLHSMAAVAHLRLADGIMPAEPADAPPEIEAALRETLRLLAQLSPGGFGSDPVLDAVAEIHAALAATG